MSQKVHIPRGARDLLYYFNVKSSQ